MSLEEVYFGFQIVGMETLLCSSLHAQNLLKILVLFLWPLQSPKIDKLDQIIILKFWKSCGSLYLQWDFPEIM